MQGIYREIAVNLEPCRPEKVSLKIFLVQEMFNLLVKKWKEQIRNMNSDLMTVMVSKLDVF